MRLTRSLALLVGVGFLAFAGIGLLVLRAEAEHDRDARVVRLADVAAAEVTGLVERTALAAQLAGDPEEFARAFTLVGPLGVVDAAVRDVARPAGVVELGSRDDAVVIIATGEAVRGTVDVPIETLAERASRHDVTLSLVPMDSVEAADNRAIQERRPWSHEGRRIYAVGVEGAPGWAVVASVADAPTIHVAQRNRLLGAALAGLLLLVLALAAFWTQQRRLVERATVDPLTRLPNRGELECRGAVMVELARRTGDGACVMVVDLDGFKTVNDTHGHAAGDEVLRVVGMRLRHAVRGYDLVGRWGGDEFVVLLSGVSDPTIASDRAQALATSVARPIEARPLSADSDPGPLATEVPGGLQVGVSIGLAMLGVHGDDLDALLVAADAAMYDAKRAGRDLAMAPTPGLLESVASEA